MVSGAIATFTTPSSGVYGQVILIGGIFFTVGTPCCALWLFGGVAMKRLLKDPSHQKSFNVSMALLLIASIVPVLWDLLSP